MSHQVRVLGPPAVVTGFALAGMPTEEGATAPVALERLRALIHDPEVGVILMDEEGHGAIPEDLRRELARRPLPMIVPFPSPTWRSGPAASSYIVELLRQVIGYRVKLR